MNSVGQQNPTRLIKSEVSHIIGAYNKGKENKYVPRFQASKRFLFLDRKDGSQGTCKICRLKYKRKMDNWEFAIYKYNASAYSPDETYFM